MKKIKVLQVIYELGDGGVESMLMDIYKNIDSNKFEFIFLVHSDKRKFESDIKRLGGKIIQINPLSKKHIFNYINKIIKICKKENIDVVHCHNLTQNPIILVSAYIANVKIRISHSHLTSCFSKTTNFLMPIIRMIISIFSTDCLACGADAGKFLYGKKKFTIINNAIDINKFVESKPIKELNNINLSNKFILIHIGRISEQKNHKFLIELMKSLSNEKDIYLFCCGNGPLYSKISCEICDEKLDNMILLGSRNDIANLLRSSNIMLLPSLYEGLPVSMIEAQASGIKTIASANIDKNSDLGLDLVDFLPIDLNSLDLWKNKILYYKKNGYNVSNKIPDVLINRGYDSRNNCVILSKIYERF